jgi:hypothetical protein
MLHVSVRKVQQSSDGPRTVYADDLIYVPPEWPGCEDYTPSFQLFVDQVSIKLRIDEDFSGIKQYTQTFVHGKHVGDLHSLSIEPRHGKYEDVKR